MREFGSLGEMAVHLAASVTAVRAGMERGLEKALVRIEKTAHDELGYYQEAVGPYPGWAELAQSTQDEREAAGYTPNDPLFRSGELQDSLGHAVDREALEGVVGAADEVAPYMEFGTSRVPPRPFLGPAAYRNLDAIRKLVGAATVAGLIGGENVHEALGYSSEIPSGATGGG